MKEKKKTFIPEAIFFEWAGIISPISIVNTMGNIIREIMPY